MCELLLPADELGVIKYFTARVVPRTKDPDQPLRQQMYLRALQTIPNLEVYYGQFLTHAVRLPLADGTGFAEVLRAEEKGSDVALATHLVHDAHRGLCDTAVVVSNDSDLVAPVRVVREALRLKVGLLCPRPSPSRALVAVVSFVKVIRTGVLRASQFPDTICDAHGEFHKPTEW